jgi:hypothetical protein
MPNVSTTTAANFIPEIWSKEIQVARDRTIGLGETVDRLDSLAAKGGDIIHTPKMANMTAADKAANTQLTFVSNTEGEVQLVINKHKVTPFAIEDIVAVQSAYELRNKYTSRAGESISLAFEADIAAAFNGAGFTQEVGDKTSGGTTTRLAMTSLTKAARLLNSANVPQTDRYFAVDAFGLEQLSNIEGFQRYDSMGEAGLIRKGKPSGRLFGFEIVLTNSVGAALPVVTNVGTMFAYHKDAVQAAIQKFSIETEYSVRDLATLVAVQQIYGTVGARFDHGVKVFAGVA